MSNFTHQVELPEALTLRVASQHLCNALQQQVISPPVGGALAQVFGWRSVFVPLAGICVLTGVLLLVSMRRETLPYFVLMRMAQKDPAAAADFQEWEEVMAHPPKFDAPWVPLK